MSARAVTLEGSREACAVSAGLAYSAHVDTLARAAIAWRALELAPVELMSGFYKLEREVSLYLEFVELARAS